jgi:hypothetical protein
MPTFYETSSTLVQHQVNVDTALIQVVYVSPWHIHVSVNRRSHKRVDIMSFRSPLNPTCKERNKIGDHALPQGGISLSTLSGGGRERAARSIDMAGVASH